MKKLKSVIAAALAAMMVLTMAGCDEEGGDNGASTPAASIPKGDTAASDGGAGGTAEESVSVVKVDFSDSATEEAAKNTIDQLAYPDLKVTKRLKWMAWWDMDETDPAAILFKEAYGIPETGDDPEAAGRIFEYQACTWDNRFDKLATAIAGDASPDFFPFEGSDFPYGILMNRYQSIDDIVDVNSERWSGAKDLMDQYVVNGKYYCAFTEVSMQQLMWYRKSNIDAIGADDPQELYKQDKWDWDAFLKLARAWKASGTDDDPRFTTDGWNTAEPFVCSTGVPQVGSSGGKIVSNYYSSEFERAMDKIILVMHNEGLRYPYEELNNWQVNNKAWADGTTLFWCTGDWDYTGVMQKFKKKYKWPDDEIKVVPFPRDPSADKYYAEVKQDSIMWVKGSTNASGVQAWLDCKVVTALDPAVKEAAKEKAIKNPETGWTKELLDFVYDCYKLDGKLTFVVELKNGLGPTTSGAGNTEDPVYGITMLPYTTGQLEGEPVTYPQLRDKFKGIIDSAIDEINNRLD